jgi:NADPH2:quinone reductase
MRAVRCEAWGEPESLVVAETALRAPGAGEIRVRVRAAGLNFPDMLTVQGKYQVKPELPFTPGREFAGDVLAVGEAVDGFAVGDRVAGLCETGAFAEEAIAFADACEKLPSGVSYDAAGGFILAYGTSWHALRDRAGLQAGETLLVLGAAGGVGLAAVEIGHAMGARVIAAASAAEKLAACRAAGAGAVINTSEEQLRPALAALCPAGPDVIYDPVGGKLTEAAFRSVNWRGRHLVVGFADGAIPALPANLALLKGASFVGVFWGAYTTKQAEDWRRARAEMFVWLAEGKLKPKVTGRFALTQIAQAMAAIAERKVIGKVIIVP